MLCFPRPLDSVLNVYSGVVPAATYSKCQVVRSDRNRPSIICWHPTGYLVTPHSYLPPGIVGLSWFLPEWHVTMTTLQACKLPSCGVSGPGAAPSQLRVVPCSRCDDPSRQSGPSRSSRTSSRTFWKHSSRAPDGYLHKHTHPPVEPVATQQELKKEARFIQGYSSN